MIPINAQNLKMWHGTAMHICKFTRKQNETIVNTHKRSHQPCSFQYKGMQNAEGKHGNLPFRV
jgi:hypothetical protein